MSEFADVVRRRRMTRSFRSDPFGTDLLDVARRSRLASAERRQVAGVARHRPRGRAETAQFWDITLPPMRRRSFRWKRLLDAPVIAASVRRCEGVHRSLLRARQGGHRPRDRPRCVAGPVLDDRRFDVYDDAAPRRRGRRPRRLVLRRVQRRARAAADLAASHRDSSCSVPSRSAGRRRRRHAKSETASGTTGAIERAFDRPPERTSGAAGWIEPSAQRASPVICSLRAARFGQLLAGSPRVDDGSWQRSHGRRRRSPSAGGVPERRVERFAPRQHGSGAKHLRQAQELGLIAGDDELDEPVLRMSIASTAFEAERRRCWSITGRAAAGSGRHGCGSAARR